MTRWCLRLDRSLSDDNRLNAGCTDGCPHNMPMGDGKGFWSRGFE